MTTPIRCLLVDDEPPALDELSYLLSAFEDVTVAGTASSASQALEEIARLRPDVVFQDIQMPGATGFHVLEHAMENPQPPRHSSFSPRPTTSTPSAPLKTTPWTTCSSPSPGNG